MGPAALRDRIARSEHRTNPWLPAIAVMLTAAMEMLDTSVVNVSLRHIAGSLSSTVDEATWVLTSYIVANAIILPISGWLASYFGRKRLLMTVVTGFTVSSLLCGIAPTLGWLIFFRVMQGITGGGLVPLSQAVLLEAFPVEQRGKAMAFWGIGMIAFPILGPTVGGWLTDNYSWRWVFYVNLPVGITSLLMLSIFLHDPHYLRRTTARVDALGLALLAVGMGSFQIMLDKGQQEDWFSSHLIVALGTVAVVGLTAFVIREFRTRDPLVDFRLFRFRTFTAGVFVGGVIGFVLFGSLVLIPLFMQVLLNFPALTAGMWSAPRGIGTLVFMPIVGLMLGKRVDARLILTSGLLVASGSFFMFSSLDLSSGGSDFMWPQIIQGAGLSMVFVPLTTIAMDAIPLQSMGYATSLFSMIRNIGSSMGISFVTTQIARRSQFHQQRLTESVTAFNPAVREAMRSFGATMGGGAVDSTRGLGMLYGRVVRQAMAMSYLELFHLLGILFLIVTPLVWFMRRPRSRSAAPAGH